MNQKQAIAEMLNMFSKMEPKLSKQLTKATPKGERGTEEAKLKKIQFIIDRYPQIFERIANHIFEIDPHAFGDLGYSSKSLIHSIHKLVSVEPVGGSYASKYDVGQSEL